MSNNTPIMGIAIFAIAIITLGIVSLIGIDINQKVNDKTALNDLTAATAELDFANATTNVTDHRYLNISNLNGTMLMRFEFNVTGSDTKAAYAIEVPIGTPTVINATNNLTQALRDNGTINAEYTITNSTTWVKVTAKTLGSSINGRTFQTTEINATVTGNLAGGTDRDTYYNGSQDSVDSFETGFDFVEILILGVIATFIIGLFLNMLGIVRL